MTVQNLAGVTGGKVEIDLCFGCRGIWFDPQENLKLAPSAVVDLFEMLNAHRHDAVSPLANQLNCVRCGRALAQGFDVVRSGRYITWRCPQRHGRFSTFSSFMIEKGFVRQLTQAEVTDMAKKVAVINCTSCGAPVDLRKDHACSYCRSALSLLDPQAVEKALQGYARAAHDAAGGIKVPDFADALVMLERDRQRAEREEQAHSGVLFSSQTALNADLWETGIELVWRMLR